MWNYILIRLIVAICAILSAPGWALGSNDATLGCLNLRQSTSPWRRWCLQCPVSPPLQHTITFSSQIDHQLAIWAAPALSKHQCTINIVTHYGGHCLSPQLCYVCVLSCTLSWIIRNCWSIAQLFAEWGQQQPAGREGGLIIRWAFLHLYTFVRTCVISIIVGNGLIKSGALNKNRNK